MPDDPVKRRLRNAQRRAMLALEAAGYRVSPAFEPFHIEAARVSEIRKVRIALDKASPEEVRIVRDYPSPPTCPKEIWIVTKSGKKFEIQAVL